MCQSTHHPATPQRQAPAARQAIVVRYLPHLAQHELHGPLLARQRGHPAATLSPLPLPSAHNMSSTDRFSSASVAMTSHKAGAPAPPWGSCPVGRRCTLRRVRARPPPPRRSAPWPTSPARRRGAGPKAGPRGCRRHRAQRCRKAMRLNTSPTQPCMLLSTAPTSSSPAASSTLYTGQRLLHCPLLNAPPPPAALASQPGAPRAPSPHPSASHSCSCAAGSPLGHPPAVQAAEARWNTPPVGCRTRCSTRTTDQPA